MFRFEHPYMLWALLVIPCWLLGLWFVQRWRIKAKARLADPALLDRLLIGQSSFRKSIKKVLWALAMIFLIIGLSNPQMGSKEVEVKREGIELSIALDVSNSMLAEDLSPNRLERAKRAILQLLDQLKGDKISIIVFGGQAYTQLPMTTDYAAGKLFVQSVNTGMIPTQGTAIGAAISLCQTSFPEGSKSKKAIIIITDGENHEDNAVEAAQEAFNKGIVVHTIGMGSAQGAPLPLYRQGHQVGFRKDRDGNTVISRINESMMQKIAAAGHGAYVRASNAQVGLDLILEEIQKMDKTAFESKMFADYEDHFYFFLAISVLLLIVEILISEASNAQSTLSKWLNK